MTVTFFMDVHVPLAITEGLRKRGVAVVTAQEDGSAEFPDAMLLDPAGELGAVLFTCDADFLAEATHRHRRGEDFTTVIYTHQRSLNIGDCIRDPEIFASAAQPGDLRSRILFLPL